MNRKLSSSGRRPLIDRLESRSYLSAVSFSGPTFVTDLSTVTGIATGDLTGNGESDIVVAGTQSSSNNPVVAIYLSNSGTFGTPTLIPVTDPPAGVAVGDFLDNGHQDIAVVDPVDNTLDVLLNDGKGNFSQGAGAGLGGAPGDTGIAVGDFSDNGLEDVAVVDPADNLIVTELSAGDTFGRFVAGATVSIPSPTQVVCGDFTNDGYDDLAILSSANPNSVYIAMNNGGGGFGTPTPYALGNGIQSITSIALADLSGNKMPDVIALGTQTGGASVADVLMNQGGGVFSPATPVSVSAGGLLAATGTFSGSGNQDFGSISSSGALDILPGNGAGGFGPDQQVFTTQLGTPATQAVVGDFNGDDRPDIAFISSASSGGFGVLLNTTGGSLTPPLLTGTPSPLTPKLLGPLPKTAVVAGVKITPIHERVELTNTASTTLKGPVTVSLLLSTTSAGSTADSTLTTLKIKNLTLKSHKSITESLTIKSPLPSSASGSYYLVALVTDPSNLQNSGASSTTFSVVPPYVDLTGAFAKVPASAKLGHSASVSFNVTNDGTIAAVGPLEVKVYASTSGVIDSSAVEIDDLDIKHANIRPGKPMRVGISKTIASTAGKYFIILDIDPANTFHETNIANNTIVSAAPGVSVS